MAVMQIKYKWSDKVLFEAEAASIRDLLQQAVKKGADLKSACLEGADLKGADLESAYLKGAYLKGADLKGAYLKGACLKGADLEGAKMHDDTILDTGETWKEYLTETLPALCTAAGKTMEQVAAAWDCHEWSNCPMHVAFDIRNADQGPILLRPRIRQFVQLFDAGLIPCPVQLAKASQ